MKKTVQFLAVMLLVSMALAVEIMDSCYACAKAGNRNWICRAKDPLNSQVTCCSPGDEEKTWCQENEARICSKRLLEGPEYFSYCPLINQTGCGIPYSGNSSDLTLWAKEEPTVFKWDKLRRTEGSAEGHGNYSGACVYAIGPPTLQYKTSTIYLKVNEIGPDVRLYLQSGTDI